MLDITTFSGRDIQNTIALLQLFITDGTIDAENIVTYLRKHIQDNISTETPLEYEQHKSLKCNSCGSVVNKIPVNISKCTQTGNPRDKFVLMCINNKCLYTEYVQG